MARLAARGALRFEPRLAARGALFELVHLRRPASIRLQQSGLEARLRRAFDRLTRRT